MAHLGSFGFLVGRSPSSERKNKHETENKSPTSEASFQAAEAKQTKTCTNVEGQSSWEANPVLAVSNQLHEVYQPQKQWQNTSVIDLCWCSGAGGEHLHLGFGYPCSG